LHPVSVVSPEDIRDEVFRVLLGSISSDAIEDVSRNLRVPIDLIRKTLEIK